MFDGSPKRVYAAYGHLSGETSGQQLQLQLVLFHDLFLAGIIEQIRISGSLQSSRCVVARSTNLLGPELVANWSPLSERNSRV